MILTPIRFIAEPIQPHFDAPPALEKTPECPQAFTWREERYQVEAVLSEWRDYTRRGRMARNMQPAHAAAAARKGSWGVGQFYFRVRTGSGRIFDIYYDRSPKNADQRKGSWTIYQELEEQANDEGENR
jgi:hypothetical protein